jgi:hypothetical protein
VHPAVDTVALYVLSERGGGVLNTYLFYQDRTRIERAQRYPIRIPLKFIGYSYKSHVVFLKNSTAKLVNGFADWLALSITTALPCV